MLSGCNPMLYKGQCKRWWGSQYTSTFGIHILVFFFFFPFQYTHLSFGLSSTVSLGEHSKISAQRASCRDSVNRRHQPENLTTIFYAISSTRYNKVFHSDYTTTHNAHIGQLIQF